MQKSEKMFVFAWQRPLVVTKVTTLEQKVE